MPEGRRLHVRRCSDAPARVLMIHGLGDGSFVWDSVIQQLDPSLALATLDLCGHGESDWDPLGRYDAGHHATDVARTLQDLGWNDITLVGHSFGASVAIHVAAKCVDGIRGLVLVDGGPELQPHALIRIREQLSEQNLQYASVTDYAERLRSRLPLARRAALDQFAQNALGTEQQQGFRLKCDPALYTNVSRPDKQRLWEDLEAIRCPILLVRGAFSAALPGPVARSIAGRLRNCRFVTVPAAGHAVMLDNPAGLCAAIEPFLKEIEQAGPPGHDVK
jgi:pimeloyl-ACP methyl ester carboxylesterase